MIQSCLHVIVGLVFQGTRICVAQRPFDKSHAGWWEFPGGKVEPGETAFSALCRELYEEINIHVTKASPWLSVPPNKELKNTEVGVPVWLDVWHVNSFTGILHGAEGQKIRWLALKKLPKLKLLAANRPIVEKLLRYS